MPFDPVDLDSFMTHAKALGLQLSDTEQRELFDGLEGLNAMIASLPDDLGPRDVPATLFCPMAADDLVRP